MDKSPRGEPGAISPEMRRAIYYRLHWLWPVLARPAVGRGLRWLGWGLFAGWLLFVALLLALRYAVLPSIGDYRGQIEQLVSRAVGQPVRVGRITAHWQGLNPDFVLDDIAVADRQGQTVFSLPRVEGVLSWQSLWRLTPHLAQLIIERPVLSIQRDSQGRITVAGMATAGGDSGFARWALAQRHIRVRDATIVWEDGLRRAPQLILDDLQFGLDNSGRRHRFGLSAAPPAALADRIDLRGEISGDLGEALEHFAGKVFVKLDYADLAGWKAWIDYPVDLPQGRGALRVWGDLQHGKGTLAADLALEDVRIRLGRDLPELALASMRGRIMGSYRQDAWSVGGRDVELRTVDGLRVAPTTFLADWQRDPASAAVSGTVRAEALDLAAFGSLAAYLPLDPESRRLLERHQPRGRISGLRASWRRDGDKLPRYALKASFADLGLRADGSFPGASGLSGLVDLNEKGGQLTLDSGPSRLSLPAVFPEPDIALTRLKARASWKMTARGADVDLASLEFAGPDADGSAHGSYRYDGDGPGEIDLQASVDRADGSAVWRYMPLAVNADARAWLKRGIVRGRGYDARLVLKGNLKDFPFRDGRGGQFLVTAKAEDVTIDYAPGWPIIEHVNGDMRFGVGMKVTASSGSILGARLSAVTVELPDFEAEDERLIVHGTAQGPTAEFFRFIDRSPVAETIDHFTDGMKAQGNGRLGLDLDIPLRHALDTRVHGNYVFQNNQLQPIAGLPSLTRVNGQLELTENSVRADDITGLAFGGPLKVQVGSTGDRVNVLASGRARIAAVSAFFGWPLIDQLAGSANWKATVGIRHRDADVVVESDLLGISSPLPEPLNKNATMTLPLRIERTAPDPAHEQYRITLGKIARGLIVRNGERWERGAFAVGDADAGLPDKGLAIRISQPSIDADAWKNYLPGSDAAPTAGAVDGGLALASVGLKAGTLKIFNRRFNNVDIAVRPRDDGWQIGLKTTEAAGDVFWKSGGEGWIEGRFKRLVLRPGAAASEGGTPNLQPINSLPGMNLSVDDFRVGDKALGKLELKAANDRGTWHLDRLSLKNPDGSLSGKGAWVNAGRNRTSLDFELDANDIGKLLERLGYADAVRRGSAKLSGNLYWDGPLTDIDYRSLTGQMNVHAENGQFNKLEPGVGKLLGLISLQSIPRRLTLDFRDIFSNGLAFDSIDGKLAVARGVMQTTGPLRISGPAAQIEMTGSTDLERETQDLQVIVRPELGGLAAVGTAALINPVAGAAALVANTVLKKPLNRLFAYRYHVTGDWNDPQVDKLDKTEKPAAGEDKAKEGYFP